MSFERDARMIDKDGNFIFENKRNEKVNDAWMDGLEQDGLLEDQEKVAPLDSRSRKCWTGDGRKGRDE